MARLDGRLGYARLAVAASREAVAGWAGPAQVPCRISTGHAGWVGVCLRDDGLGAVADDGREAEDVVRQLSFELGAVAVCIRLDGDALRIAGFRAGAGAVQLTSPGPRGDGTIDQAASTALAACVAGRAWPRTCLPCCDGATSTASTATAHSASCSACPW